MKINQLTRFEANKKKKRVGRGIAAGGGKTAGRGTKGQKARSKIRPGFEGGQTPISRRLPKLAGFKSHRPKTQVVYTGSLDGFKKTITPQALAAAGLIKDPYLPVKLIKKGAINQAHQVELTGASAGAIASLKEAGGSFVAIKRLKQVGQKKVKKEAVKD